MTVEASLFMTIECVTCKTNFKHTTEVTFNNTTLLQ